MKLTPASLLLIPLLCISCTAQNAAVSGPDSQLMLRQAQTREYEDVTEHQAMRASIATLQDLDFILSKVDGDLQTLSGSKYRGGMKVNITITVRGKGSSTVLVRANATYGQRAIEDPDIYQDFFCLLDKSLFLLKNQVD